MFQRLQDARKLPVAIVHCGTWGASYQGLALSCGLPLIVDLGGPHNPNPPAATLGHHQAVPCSDPARQVSASTLGCWAAQKSGLQHKVLYWLVEQLCKALQVACQQAAFGTPQAALQHLCCQVMLFQV